ncbi:hypothetical protein QBC42DRAFT_344624 [Cladorrhinum samala]|uniref:BZIP domain-containing protein n=1 Tax=Cladorrhinum samala TaxID=585594 RepID=A0AAV9HUN2_9PEZI|nr:hypothetical protein QBC42DRAFT_344624 [Cladorrhinum samala]
MTHKHTKAMSRDAWTRIGRPAACIKFGSWDLKQEALEAAEPQTREIDVSPPTDRLPRPRRGAVCILQEWAQQHQQQQQALDSPPYSFTCLNYTGFDLDLFSDINNNNTQWDLQIPVSFPQNQQHQQQPPPSLLLTPDLGSVADFDYTALDLSQVQIPLSFPDLHDASLSPFPPPASNFPTPSCTGATNTESSSASPVSTVDSSPSTLVPGLKLPTPTPSTASTTTPKPKGRPGRKPTKKRPRSSSPEEDDEEDPDVIDKRQRNNLAAKRYRQKKVDRIEELEGEVKEVSKERDELKLEVARKDAEIKALREMLEMVQRDRDRERDKGM